MDKRSAFTTYEIYSPERRQATARCETLMALLVLARSTGVLSVMAFHEKAGRSQVGSCLFSLDKFVSPAESPCRHPSIRTLDERFLFARCKLGVLVSAGAAT